MMSIPFATAFQTRSSTVTELSMLSSQCSWEFIMRPPSVEKAGPMLPLSSEVPPSVTVTFCRSIVHVSPWENVAV